MKVDVIKGIQQRLGVSREEAERLAHLPLGEEVSAEDFFKLAMLELDGSDPPKLQAVVEARYKVSQSVLLEQRQVGQRKAAAKRKAKRQAVIDEAKVIIRQNRSLGFAGAFKAATDALGNDVIGSRRAEVELKTYFQDLD